MIRINSPASIGASRAARPDIHCFVGGLDAGTDLPAGVAQKSQLFERPVVS